MPEIDHRRAIAKSLIRGAITFLETAEVTALDPSDKKIVPVAHKKLIAVLHSLGSTTPLGDDSTAAKLSAVAASLMHCNAPELKRGAYLEVMKAAKIFDELSQGL